VFIAKSNWPPHLTPLSPLPSPPPAHTLASMLLDGGMGRELKARGAPWRQPEWSALALWEAPSFVQEAHEAFIASGAEVVTTNSFALVPFHIGQERFEQDGEMLASLSGQLAKAAIQKSGRSDVLVAASLPPPFGAYSPESFTSAEEAERILGCLVQGLSPHADIWLAETLSSTAEARAACAAVRNGGTDSRPLWLAFSLRRVGGAQSPCCALHSGESIADAVAVARELHASSLLFNCAPPELMAPALIAAREALAEDSGIQLGAYANSFCEEHAESPEPANCAVTALRPEITPMAYAEFAREWRRLGARMIGGCCGIGPQHIAALRELGCQEERAAMTTA